MVTVTEPEVDTEAAVTPLAELMPPIAFARLVTVSDCAVIDAAVTELAEI